MPEVTVTDLDTNVSSNDEMDPEGLILSAMDFAEAIFTQSWKSGTLEEQVSFRNKLSDFFTAATTLRVRFDAQVWAGHDDGSISEDVESIRARRMDNGQKPGRKPAVKTLAEQLLKR